MSGLSFLRVRMDFCLHKIWWVGCCSFLSASVFGELRAWVGLTRRNQRDLLLFFHNIVKQLFVTFLV